MEVGWRSSGRHRIAPVCTVRETLCDDRPVADFDAYCARLGVARRRPSIDALFELHRAHVERVPYETLWIANGDRRTIDPEDSIAAINAGHGGYCFQLNGAFSALLAHLGYHVTRHAGAVHGSDGPTPAQLYNHLVLQVHELPTDENPSGTWYVDAGLGDALHEPLPLVAGTYAQGPLMFSLEPSDHPDYDWLWRHDPKGAFAGMSFRTALAQLDDFAPKHLELSTSAASLFVNNLILMRRHVDGSSSITNLLSTETTAAGAKRRLVVDRDEWFALVSGRFGRDTSSLSAVELDRIWGVVQERLAEYRAAHPSTGA